MRVGFGSTVWSRLQQNSHMDGIGYYSKELCRNLTSCAEVQKLVPVVFGSRGSSMLEGNQVKNLPNYRFEASWSAASGMSFFGASSLCNLIDIFHAPDHYTPHFKHIPVVATLMDAIPLSHPQWASQRARNLKNWLWRKSGHWADHIVTISEFSKNEIVRCFGIDDDKISVIPLGVDECYFDRLSVDTVDQVVSDLNLPERFFLFVGTLQPRKNIERILDAHEALPPALRKAIPLLVVGRNGWGSDALIARLTANGSDGEIRWLKNVGELAKRVMMQRATALVFPSLVEGFGLPVLEGFASQTPVITSNVTSIPEVAGDAALMVDPLNVRALSDAMWTLTREDAVRRDMVVKGLMRARQFSWGACARRTVEVYEKVISKC